MGLVGVCFAYQRIKRKKVQCKNLPLQYVELISNSAKRGNTLIVSTSIVAREWGEFSGYEPPSPLPFLHVLRSEAAGDGLAL